MARYIALLRGINVGGNNIIKMADLRSAFVQQGFENVITYINSGNILFESDLGELAAKDVCEKLLLEGFGLDIPVCVISAADLTEALAHAPAWWNTTPDTRHDVILVIPPKTAADICAHVGAVKEEYERVAFYGKVIFWSAPMVTFSRTRWSKISKDKAMYRSLTVRNANTALKLVELAGVR